MAKPPKRKRPAAKRRAKKPTDRRGAPKGEFKNPPFEPTDEQRIQVEAMIAAGTKHAIIAELMGFSEDTLKRHFDPEVERGRERALAKIGGSFVQKALDPKDKDHHDAQKYVLARIGGWKTTTSVEASGPGGGPIEYRNLSDEELDARIAALTGNAAAAAKD